MTYELLLQYRGINFSSKCNSMTLFLFKFIQKNFRYSFIISSLEKSYKWYYHCYFMLSTNCYYYDLFISLSIDNIIKIYCNKKYY